MQGHSLVDDRRHAPAAGRAGGDRVMGTELRRIIMGPERLPGYLAAARWQRRPPRCRLPWLFSESHRPEVKLSAALTPWLEPDRLAMGHRPPAPAQPDHADAGHETRWCRARRRPRARTTPDGPSAATATCPAATEPADPDQPGDSDEPPANNFKIPLPTPAPQTAFRHRLQVNQLFR